MKIALLQNDKSFLSFDLKDLLWLILVMGVWATQDYRIKYANNVLKFNGDLQDKIRVQNDHILQLKEQLEGAPPPTLANIIRLEEESVANVNRSLRFWDSMPSSAKVSQISQLHAVLDAVTKVRDALISAMID